MTRISNVKPRKRSLGTGSLGLKNAGSSTAVSRISNDDLNSLQSDTLSFSNYKSSPIAYRKYSYRGQTPADDQQSLINFEKFPELAELNQLNSISSSADSSTNQPMFAAYLQGQHTNPNTTNSRFSVYKSQQPSPQPHQLVSQLNQKLAHLERTNQLNHYNQNYVPNYPPNNYPHMYQQQQQTTNPADDAISTVSTISGLQMTVLPSEHTTINYDRSNSRTSETKVTIEDEKPQTTTIFNINNTSNNTLFTKPIESNTTTTTASTTRSDGLPPMSPITTPLNIVKIDMEPNDLERSDKEPSLETLKDSKELVTIVEEEKSDSPNSSQSDVNTSVIENPAIKIIKEPANESKKEKDGDKRLGKKLSVDSIYEPNSSQESLSPFQSNQNTVTSFADWINKAEEKKDDD